MSTKIKCLTFIGSDRRTYKGPSGTEYEFYKGRYTVVDDPEDAMIFLKAGNGKSFEALGKTKEVMSALEKLIKKLKKEDKVDEENPPEETGALEPTKEEMSEDDTAPIDGEEEAPGKEENKGIQVFTAKGLTDLKKDEQVYMIKHINGEKADIPRKEADRVKLLLKLQEDGNDLQGLLDKAA
jgi:hypothetical protein